MPPKNASGTKRKAPLAAADSNIAPPAKKVATGKTTAAGAAIAPSGQKSYKYSDASSLDKELPGICTVMWPKSCQDTDSDDEEDDEDGDDEGDKSSENETEKENTTKEKDGDKNGKKEQPRVVTDKFYPITHAGFEIFKNTTIEQEKRDPDLHGLYIYNDYAGYGMTEVLENLLADFNKILFKKDVSPIQKWGYIEGLTTWLFVGDLANLMMSDDSERVGEVFSFFITLMVTGLEILSEHSLVDPTSAVPSANICTLIMIQFLKKDAEDFDITGIEKIVQAADKAGLVWDFRKEIGVTEKMVQELRDTLQAKTKQPDWKKEWPSFKRNHPGGKQYDITKMSKAQKKQHALGRSHDENGWEWIIGAKNPAQAAFIATYGSEFGDVFE